MSEQYDNQAAQDIQTVTPVPNINPPMQSPITGQKGRCELQDRAQA